MNKNLEQPRKQFSAILYPLCAGLILALASACGGGGGGSSSASKPGLTVEGATVSEGNQDNVEMLFTVTLSEDAPSTVTLSYRTVDGTAEVAEGDYIAASDQLTIAEGSRSASVSVYVKGDGDYEADETVTLVVDSVQGVSLEQSSYSGSGTISNDDNAEPAGYYSGSAILNGTDYDDIMAMAYDNRILMFSATANLLYDISLDSVTLADYSGTAQVYVNGDITDTDSRQNVTLSGSTDEATISGSFAGSTGFGAGSFTLSFDESSNIGATIDRIVVAAGRLDRWIGDIYGVEVSQDVGQFIPYSDGSYLATDLGSPSCQYSGDLGISATALNIYELAHDVETVDGCLFVSSNHTGFASIISISGVDTLVYAFANGEYSFFFIGEKG